MNVPTEQSKIAAREKMGALLPNTDPSIAEIVLSTLFANEMATLPAIAVALIRDAPSEIALEVANALFEVVTCHDRGDLFWLETPVQAILVGVRSSGVSHALLVGNAKWPMQCLLVGPPKSATIRVPNGARQVWLACEPLDGVIIRQSEAVALGNAMIEAFGGRIIEDRQGPDVMHQSFIEGNMSKRAKARAEAAGTIERLSVEPRARVDLRPGHAVIQAAEALPGTLEVGMTLHPVTDPSTVYEVLRRINDSWVLLVAREPGSDQVVSGGPWMRCDERGSFPQGPLGPDTPPDWAFTESDSVVPEIPQLVVLEEVADGEE